MKEIDTLVRQVRRAGHTVVLSSRHWKISTPGGPVFIPCTPSDPRSLNNARALLKRKGVVL